MIFKSKSFHALKGWYVRSAFCLNETERDRGCLREREKEREDKMTRDRL